MWPGECCAMTTESWLVLKSKLPPMGSGGVPWQLDTTNGKL